MFYRQKIILITIIKVIIFLIDANIHLQTVVPMKKSLLNILLLASLLLLNMNIILISYDGTQRILKNQFKLKK
jgi:hypothetical protein